MQKRQDTKNCKNCSQHFEVTQNDRDFYKKVSPSFVGKKYQIPDPTLCPHCRRQRRLSFKNELQLYKNTCVGCGTGIISRFHEKSVFQNYCNKCWSSDNWDAREYARSVNFHRPFFEQL